MWQTSTISDMVWSTTMYQQLSGTLTAAEAAELLVKDPIACHVILLVDRLMPASSSSAAVKLIVPVTAVRAHGKQCLTGSALFLD